MNVSSSRWPSLADWLLNNEELFVQARSTTIDQLARRGPMTLDDLVVATRLPVRTVLLCLDGLARSSVVGRGNAGAVRLLDREPQHQGPQAPQALLSVISDAYLGLAATREVPALLWGQRRLVPESAIERALYIRDHMQIEKGKIIFLGDDDLVAPLVAAIAPDSEVTVIDIDSAVLRSVREVALRLDAAVSTRHADLSRFEQAEYESFDIAVADPFPSGDGSFERLFWHRAAELLRAGGTLISTLAPSHKPPDYSRGALAVLADLGFTLIDLRANFGRYETFSFEFTDYETEALGRLGLRSTIAHTKSLFAARKGDRASEHPLPSFNFDRWTAAAAAHYLTQQAGADEQALIAHDRAPTNSTSQEGASHKHGLDIACGLPAPVAARVRTAKDANALKEILRQDLAMMGISVQSEEMEELAALWADNSLQKIERSSLALALRALESWRRWRFDERN